MTRSQKLIEAIAIMNQAHRSIESIKKLGLSKAVISRLESQIESNAKEINNLVIMIQDELEKLPEF